MINKLQNRLNLSDQEVSLIKKEQADVVFNKKILWTIMATLIISLILQMITREPILIFGLFIVGLLLIIGIYLYNKEKNEFSNIVKEVIIKGLFEESFSNVTYQPNKGFDEDFIEKTRLYGTGNRYSSNDLLSATYKDVGFMQADLLLQQVTSNGKTTTTTTLFHGRWFICDFIKDFDGYHQIRSNGFFKNKKPFAFFGDKLKHFEFEDQSFNDRFTTYTTNKQEAYYLINPGYMQRITDFVDYVNCEVVLGLIDNKLHVAIFNNEDAFELKGKNINEDFVSRIENDIKLIKMIIDELDLQLDIFK